MCLHNSVNPDDLHYRYCVCGDSWQNKIMKGMIMLMMVIIDILINLNDDETDDTTK